MLKVIPATHVIVCDVCRCDCGANRPRTLGVVLTWLQKENDKRTMELCDECAAKIDEFINNRTTDFHHARNAQGT